MKNFNVKDDGGNVVATIYSAYELTSVVVEETIPAVMDNSEPPVELEPTKYNYGILNENSVAMHHFISPLNLTTVEEIV